jgi:AraC-like DNA-binding protein
VGQNLSVSSDLVFAVISAAAKSKCISKKQILLVSSNLGLEKNLTPRRDFRLPYSRLDALWSSLSALDGDHSIGAKLAPFADTKAFSILGETVARSPSLLDAFSHVASFVRLVHQGVTISTLRSNSTFTVRYAIHSESREPRSQGSDAGLIWALSNLAQIPRRVFGLELLPLSTTLRCRAPHDLSPLTAMFGEHIKFDAQFSEIRYRWADIHSTKRAPDDLMPHLKALAHQDLEKLPSATDTVALATEQVSICLAGGAPKVQDIARNLGLSTRTLQRRLKEQNASFDEVLDNARRHRAEYLITYEQRNLSEIAYLVGYGEQAAFTRAAKRWFGVPPSQFKLSQRKTTRQR